MANIKVSEMTEATVFDDGDYTMIVQANQNKKILKENMLGSVVNDISAINTTIGELQELNTLDKTSVVNSINSVNSNKINDLIQVGISTSQTSISANTATLIPFNTTTQQIGTNLTLTNNKIVVGGEGLSGKIKLNFLITGSSSNSLNYCYAYIYKNGEETADIFNSGAGTLHRFYLTRDIILDYESGDEFSLYFGSDVASQIISSYYRTIMTAEILTY